MDINPYWILRTNFRMNPYWICGHLKLVKIVHESLLKFVDIFPHECLLNLWASKPISSWAELLTEFCSRILYWICEHLNLFKFGHDSLLNFVAYILNEFCSTILYCICGHLNLFKIGHNCGLNFVALILTEFCSIIHYWICEHLNLFKIGHNSLLNFVA